MPKHAKWHVSLHAELVIIPTNEQKENAVPASAAHPQLERVVDSRGRDTLRELVHAQWRHAKALAEERILPIDTPLRAKAHARVLELARSINELERTLDERPWTEV